MRPCFGTSVTSGGTSDPDQGARVTDSVISVGQSPRRMADFRHFFQIRVTEVTEMTQIPYRAQRVEQMFYSCGL
jgi:hypothetical protein